MSADNDPTAPRIDPPTRIPLSIERVALALGMAGIALITLANVVTRYLSNISLAFTEEYSVVLMVVVTLVGSSYAFAAGRHVRIDYFVELLSPRNNRRFEIASLVLVVAIFVLIVFYGAKLTWDDYRYGVLSPGLGHPEWIYVASLPVFGLAVIGRAAGRIARLLKQTEATP
jgi:TRAP-type C4-dicarboxylate transport system permease small subunit